MAGLTQKLVKAEPPYTQEFLCFEANRGKTRYILEEDLINWEKKGATKDDVVCLEPRRKCFDIESTSSKQVTYLSALAIFRRAITDYKDLVFRTWGLPLSRINGRVRALSLQSNVYFNIVKQSSFTGSVAYSQPLLTYTSCEAPRAEFLASSTVRRMVRLDTAY